MDHDENIPGLTFRVTESNKSAPACDRYKALGHVILLAEINDFSIWSEVVKKLDGMRIYTVPRFAEEMVSVAQERAKAVQAELEAASQHRDEELARLRQKLSFIEEENRQLRTANQQWAAYHQQQQGVDAGEQFRHEQGIPKPFGRR